MVLDCETTSFIWKGAALNGDWNNLEVRKNGATMTLVGSKLNDADNWDPGAVTDTENFVPGDELELAVPTALVTGDSIVILYTETGDILQRTTVS